MLKPKKKKKTTELRKQIIENMEKQEEKKKLTKTATKIRGTFSAWNQDGYYCIIG